MGASVDVFRNDEISLDDITSLQPDRIVLSPGPGSPDRTRDFGICTEILKKLSPQIPTLGVCLGHQGIGYIFGGQVRRANKPVHGKVAQIYHDGMGIFERLPQGFSAARYHSLVVDGESLPVELEISAQSEDGEIMGLRHRRYPIEGVQFHPESILTTHGKELLRNFLKTRSLRRSEVTVT